MGGNDTEANKGYTGEEVDDSGILSDLSMVYTEVQGAEVLPGGGGPAGGDMSISEFKDALQEVQPEGEGGGGGFENEGENNGEVVTLTSASEGSAQTNDATDEFSGSASDQGNQGGAPEVVEKDESSMEAQNEGRG